MVIILKYILNCRGLNEVWTGGLGSYALTLLVVNFFQQHPRKTAKESGESLGVLLLEFFELYGRNFNYEQNGRQQGGNNVGDYQDFNNYDPYAYYSNAHNSRDGQAFNNYGYKDSHHAMNTFIIKSDIVM